jgi:NAD(P)H-dependent FMN reductase
VGKRSVFIGGMSSETTSKNLLDVLSEMGMKVINHPVIKNGFARQVILDTISQAKTLITMKRIQVKGTIVDVRPFVHYRRKRRNK